MNFIVTAGPTYEELDNVRRLTNFSTGRLGSELVNFLVARGHQVEITARDFAQTVEMAINAGMTPHVIGGHGGTPGRCIRARGAGLCGGQRQKSCPFYP